MSKNKKPGGTIGSKHCRRLQDSIESKNPTRNMNYDRRLKNNERRSNYETLLDTPSRRLTIDRRMILKDRRKASN